MVQQQSDGVLINMRRHGKDGAPTSLDGMGLIITGDDRQESVLSKPYEAASAPAKLTINASTNRMCFVGAFCGTKQLTRGQHRNCPHCLTHGLAEVGPDEWQDRVPKLTKEETNILEQKRPNASQFVVPPSAATCRPTANMCARGRITGLAACGG